MPCMRRHVGTSVPRIQRRTIDGATCSARAMSPGPTPCMVRTAARYAGTVTTDDGREAATSRPRGARAAALPTDPADATLDQGVRAREQTLVRAVALDHVGQVAQLVDEELLPAAAPLGVLHDVHHVHDDVLELGRLEVDGHLEGALERRLLAELSEVRCEQRAEPRGGPGLEPHARPGRHGVRLEDALDQRQRPAVAGLGPRHREPEVPYLLRAREELREAHVQRHRLLLELDGGLEHLTNGGPPGTGPRCWHRGSLSKPPGAL